MIKHGTNVVMPVGRTACQSDSPRPASSVRLANGAARVPSRDNRQRQAPRTRQILLTACIVITRRAIASTEGRAVLNSDSYVINRNWKSLIMFGCSESNKTVYKRARANETAGMFAAGTLGTLR